MSHTILDVDDIRKSLGQGNQSLNILGGITFSAQEGEFLTIVGPSGCGKTTLLMCLAGLYTTNSGKIVFQGKKISEPPADLSIVFQDYSRSLLPWKRNLGNVLFGMQRLSMPQGEKLSTAREMLGAVGLKGFEDRYPWELSGGMQQRVAIARALASQSKLLLLDEPLAAVDAQTRAEMQDLLLKLAKQFKKTCILVTHDVDEAVYLAERVVVLSTRPTTVVETIDVAIPKPRDQIETRETADYLRIRHHVLTRIRDMKARTSA
jgi:NitT/TauT family transport system ATP-binding protein